MTLQECIANVKAFKKVIDDIADEIDSGNYNIKIIKLLSETAEQFFSESITDDYQKISKKLIPRVSYVSSPETSDDEDHERIMKMMKDDDDDEDHKRIMKMMKDDDDESDDDTFMPIRRYMKKPEENDIKKFMEDSNDDVVEMFHKLQLKRQHDNHKEDKNSDEMMDKLLNNNLSFKYYYSVNNNNQNIKNFIESCNYY